jgi:hypothetical protein
MLQPALVHHLTCITAERLPPVNVYPHALGRGRLVG